MGPKFCDHLWTSETECLHKLLFGDYHVAWTVIIKQDDTNFPARATITVECTAFDESHCFLGCRSLIPFRVDMDPTPLNRQAVVVARMCVTWNLYPRLQSKRPNCVAILFISPKSSDFDALANLLPNDIDVTGDVLRVFSSGLGSDRKGYYPGDGINVIIGRFSIQLHTDQFLVKFACQ